jgi:DNA-binding CsgD family transcriptional regulator
MATYADIFENFCVLVRSFEDDDDAGSLSEQLLFDADVEGRRYLLVRLPAEERKPPPLSPREMEVARLVAQGLPNKVIACELEISAWTVGTHVRRLFAKLGVTSRAAMVARLSGFGLSAEPAHAPYPARESQRLGPYPAQRGFGASEAFALGQPGTLNSLGRLARTTGPRRAS